MSDFSLTPDARRAVLREAATILAQMLYDETPVDQLRLISKARAAGLLDVDPKTLDSMGLPRVVLAGGKLIKYLLSDVAALIARNREK